MQNLVHSPVGAVHLFFSILALFTGTFVLVTNKGTRRHKRIGYVYVVSMFLLNGTAFMIYSLFGKFGIFHWFSVLSTVTIILGMYPLLAKKRELIRFHYSFMYWSVIGLYAAFAAEILTRIPIVYKEQFGDKANIFLSLVGVATFIVMAVGGGVYARFYNKWMKF